MADALVRTFDMLMSIEGMRTIKWVPALFRLDKELRFPGGWAYKMAYYVYADPPVRFVAHTKIESSGRRPWKTAYTLHIGLREGGVPAYSAIRAFNVPSTRPDANALAAAAGTTIVVSAAVGVVVVSGDGNCGDGGGCGGGCGGGGCGGGCG